MSLTNFHKKYLFDYFQIRKVKFPRVLFGTSPFFGAGQFMDRSTMYYQKFYLNPKNMTWLYSASILRGLNAIHVPSDPVIINAIIEAIGSYPVDSFIIATIEARNIEEELSLCEKIKANSIILHASYTDAAVEGIDQVLTMIKEHFNDIPTGIATHYPGAVIPRVLGSEMVDLILAPINLRGDFMMPDAYSTLNTIADSRKSGKKVIAIKPLAAGLLNPKKALEFLADKVDGVAVGITSLKELDELIEAARRYFI